MNLVDPYALHRLLDSDFSNLGLRVQYLHPPYPSRPGGVDSALYFGTLESYLTLARLACCTAVDMRGDQREIVLATNAVLTCNHPLLGNVAPILQDLVEMRYRGEVKCVTAKAGTISEWLFALESLGEELLKMRA